jgi:hypothetical protein
MWNGNAPLLQTMCTKGMIHKKITFSAHCRIVDNRMQWYTFKVKKGFRIVR